MLKPLCKAKTRVGSNRCKQLSPNYVLSRPNRAQIPQPPSPLTRAWKASPALTISRMARNQLPTWLMPLQMGLDKRMDRMAQQQLLPRPMSRQMGLNKKGMDRMARLQLIKVLD